MSWVVLYNHEENVTCGLYLGLYEESHLVEWAKMNILIVNGPNWSACAAQFLKFKISFR
jgi:hypothetical protein